MSAKANSALAGLEAKILDGRVGSLLAALDDLGRRIPESRIDMLGPYLENLRGLRFAGHPWARLAIGYAMQIEQYDDAAVDSFYSAAHRSFQRQKDQEGIPRILYCRGIRALTRGDLAEAADWWERCRELAGESSPCEELAMAQLALGAYHKGDLRGGMRMAEEAAAVARVHNNRRAEGLAQFYFAFLALNVGEFARCESSLQLAREIFAEMPAPEEWYEYPLMRNAQAVLYAFRGDEETAERAFEEAIEECRAIQNEWYEAFVKCTRAEFLAHRDPLRAQADARWTLDWAVAHNDAWVRGWSLRASAVAAREGGTPIAALKIFDDSLREPLAPAERVRSLISLGETLLDLGRLKDAVAPLAEAETLGRQIGANYLAVWASVRLRDADFRQSARIANALKNLVSSDPAYDRLLQERHSIEIRVLGDSGVFIDSERVKFETKKSELIVFCLALAGSAGLHTEELIDRLWGESATRHSRRRLNTEICLARAALKTLAGRLETRGDIRAIRVSSSEVDYLRLTDTAQVGLREQHVGLIEASLRELDQPLLANWRYEPWVEDLDETRKALTARLLKCR